MFFQGNFENFFRAMESYNELVYPWQFVLMATTLLALMVLNVKKAFKNRMINMILAGTWLWSMLFYFLLSLSDFSNMGYIYGFAFLLQGIFMIYEAFFRTYFSYAFHKKPKHYTGFIIALMGLFLYPVIGLAGGSELGQTVMLGLPGPTIVVTLGFLMMTDKRIPVYLLVIPSLWAFSFILVSLNIFHAEQLILYVSVLVSLIWLFSIKKYDQVKRAPLD